jgi:hypothetical protein
VGTQLPPESFDPTLLIPGREEPATPPPSEPEMQAPVGPSSEATVIASRPVELPAEPPSEPAVPTVEFTPSAPAEPTLAAEPVVTSPPPEPLPPPPPPPPEAPTAPPGPKKSNNRTWLIVAIVVLLLCCCCCILGLGAVVLWNNGDRLLRQLNTSQIPWGMPPLGALAYGVIGGIQCSQGSGFSLLAGGRLGAWNVC